MDPLGYTMSTCWEGFHLRNKLLEAGRLLVAWVRVNFFTIIMSIGHKNNSNSNNKNNKNTSWWFQPLWKILVNWIISPGRDEKWKVFETTT